MLRGRAREEFPVHGHQRRARLRRRHHLGRGIAFTRERRAQPGDVELCGEQLALRPLAVGLVHGGVELDQRIARLHALSVTHVDRTHHPDLERLDHLGAPARDDPARCRGDDVDRAERGPDERQAEQRDDGKTDRPSDRRRRRLDDLERGRQECELILATAVRPARPMTTSLRQCEWNENGAGGCQHCRITGGEVIQAYPRPDGTSESFWF
jgi:hypothetical protein